MKHNKAVLFIRGFVFWIGFAFSTFLWGGLTCLTVVFPMRVRFAFVRYWPRWNLWWLKVTCGLSYTVYGKENLPSEPSIVFAKHQSTWETLAMYYEFPDAVFVAKKQLLYIPFFGWGLAAMNYITIDRKAGKKAIKQIIEQAKIRLDGGFWVHIFPEGTRKGVEDAPNYRIGGAVAAVETQAKAVPVAHNAGYYWPRHGFIKYPGTIELHILPAIESTDKEAAELLAEVQTAIEDKMASIKPSALVEGQPGYKTV